jgi:type 2 lantibiotic biosynthesis protein LanM
MSHPRAHIDPGTVPCDARWIHSITQRATPLWERSADPGTPGRSGDPAAARERMQRWQRLLGSEQVLQRRLRAAPLSRQQLEPLLDGRTGDVDLPSWAAVLPEVLRATSIASPGASSGPSSGDRAFDPAAPVPFEDVLVGFVQYGRERVRAEIDVPLAAFQPPALAALERQLLAHLSFVASLALGRDFYEFRFRHAPASALEAGWLQRPASTALYAAYVAHMHRSGLREIFDAYPVLARLLCQSVEQWVAATSDLVRRFAGDFAALRSAFGWCVDGPAGAVAEIRTDLSDRHRGGCTVLECVLRTGERVVYKPRSVGPERAFYELVGWLNRRGLSLDLRVLQIVDRGSHGWVESVASAACGSDAEVERFYRRCGMLLAVLHALSATDIHCENLIASGEQPVLVDLETILTEHVLEARPRTEWQSGEPRPLAWPSRGAPPRPVSATAEDSVLRTGMLPRAAEGPGTQADLSALGADETQELGVSAMVWRAINTDQMTFSSQFGQESGASHRVRIGDRLPSVDEHRPAFLQGFEEAYRRLVSSRADLLADVRLVERFDSLELRVILRNTLTYTNLHLHLLHPEFLVDGVDRSLELEWLARPLSGPRSPQRDRIAVYEHERLAMERLDIPRFTAPTREQDQGASDDDDDGGDDDLRALFAVRDARVLKRNLERLDPSDCARQISAIERSLEARFAHRQA